MVDNYEVTEFRMDFIPSENNSENNSEDCNKCGRVICKQTTKSAVDMTLQPNNLEISYSIYDGAEAVLGLFQSNEKIDMVFVKLSTGKEVLVDRTDDINLLLEQMARKIEL